jgi:basic membrane protein A and related proteins
MFILTKSPVRILLITIIFVFLLGACAKTPLSDPTVDQEEIEGIHKICFIFGENIGDENWGKVQNQARLDIEETYSEIETAYVQAVPVTEELTRVLEQFIDDGCGMVILGSYYGDYATTVFENNPETKFISFDFGFSENYPNVTYFSFDYWTAQYLNGVMGGLMTKSNQLGFLDGFPGSYIAVNAFTLGARSVNPDVTVKGGYVGSWDDPVGERQLAYALVDDGADYVSGMLNSVNFIQALEERGAWGTALYLPQERFAPTSYVNSLLVNFSIFYVSEVGKFLNGTWEGDRFEIVPYGTGFSLGEWGKNVPDDVRLQVETINNKFLDGWNPFVGPIRDSTGEVRVEEGEEMSFEDLFYYWDWPVEGIIIIQ